jgi:hypothetical protein
MTQSDHTFTHDELKEMAAGHLLNEAQRQTLAEGDGEDGNWRYERVPIRGAVPRGAFRLPNHAVNALGGGDPHTGGAVVGRLFGTGTSDDPRVIHPDRVREIGGGDANAGERVLRKFVAMLRRPGAQR